VASRRESDLADPRRLDDLCARRPASRGSTITMQLARQRFGIDSRSLGGKLEQIAVATDLERHYTKNEILEAYLNTVPYGGNVEVGGVALGGQIARTRALFERFSAMSETLKTEMCTAPRAPTIPLREKTPRVTRRCIGARRQANVPQCDFVTGLVSSQPKSLGS
jgi:membrane carboxypeptidase/penicillin-binding protein PbpC